MASAFFPSSHHFVSNIGTVITATNYNQHGAGPSPERDWALELLRENISEGAMHNSNERCDIPNCHPDTRKAVQEDIFSWMGHGDRDAEPKKIMWMSGPAGCGKTSIAGSVAEACAEAGLLAASFFCSSFAGSTSRRSKRHIIPTLAYQLTLIDRSGILRKHILSSIRDDPTVFTKRLKDQCQTLLLEPLQQLARQGLALSIPRVIIIDGLDEIERVGSREANRQKAIRDNEADQVEVLSALLPIVNNPALPIRILIVSRPERRIREFFDEEMDAMTIRLFLDDKYHPDADIKLFLTSKFADIRRRYRGISPSWPSSDHIQTLVHNASGQFIYAATVMRFVQDGSKPPPDQLDYVLRLQLRPTGTENPFETLDALYTHILMSSPDPPLAVEWILTMDLIREPARWMRQLLETSAGQAEHLLGNLSSLVYAPAPDDVSSKYATYHRSLMDYLEGPGRGKEIFHVCQAPTLLERSYLRILKDKGPAVSFGSLERLRFLTHFVEAWEVRLVEWFDHFMHSDDIDHSPNGILAQCDVPWWMSEVAGATPPGARRSIVFSFIVCHYSCQRGQDDGACNAACRNWRRGVLSFCRQRGWTVPREAETVVATGYDIVQWYDYDLDAEELRFNFRPPGPSVAHLLATADERDSIGISHDPAQLEMTLQPSG